MNPNALSQLNVDATTCKRAAYEGHEFTLESPGCVRVTNGSYGDDKEDHSYLVTIDGGVPSACECESFEYRDGACKHMTAVAIRTPVLDAASTPGPSPSSSHAPQPVRADGGVVASNIIEAPDDGVILDDDDAEDDEEDADGESDTGQQKLRSEAHTIALDAYDASPLPDFDVFGEIISCSTDSVRRAIETGVGR
jgi:hypothetical protein